MTFLNVYNAVTSNYNNEDCQQFKQIQRFKSIYSYNAMSPVLTAFLFTILRSVQNDSQLDSSMS